MCNIMIRSGSTPWGRIQKKINSGPKNKDFDRNLKFLLGRKCNLDSLGSGHSVGRFSTDSLGPNKSLVI